MAQGGRRPAGPGRRLARAPDAPHHPRMDGAAGYLILKYLHVLGAVVILGTGSGIAFFMLMADRSREPAFIARTAGVVVLADFIFTATAICLQPITGWLLLRRTGGSFAE